MKAREFWIFKGRSGFADEMALNDDCNEVRNQPEGFYDLVSESDSIEGGIHVIEKSAYDELLALAEEMYKCLDLFTEDLDLEFELFEYEENSLKILDRFKAFKERGGDE